MSRRGLRIAAALALAVLLVTATPLAAAGPDGGLGRAASNRTVLEALWAWARVWLGLPSGETTPAGIPGRPKAACDGGSMVDPNGRPAQGSAAGDSSDGGLMIDPNG